MSERQDTLQQYVSDMLAVEKHIHEALRRQQDDESIEDHPQAAALIRQIEETLDQHIASLEAHLEALGGDLASPAKEAVAAALGVAAGLIDMVRTQQVSKMLRDDYTALSLAAVSYTMLHTTGLALNDQATADLALRHLGDYTRQITDLSHVVPHVVAKELADDAHNVDTTVGGEAERNTQRMWDPALVS